MSLIWFLKGTWWQSHLTQNCEVNQGLILTPSCLFSLHTFACISQILAGSILHIQKDPWEGFAKVQTGLREPKGVVRHQGTEGNRKVFCCHPSSEGQREEFRKSCGLGKRPCDKTNSSNLEGEHCCPTCQRESWRMCISTSMSHYPVICRHIPLYKPKRNPEGKRAHVLQPKGPDSQSTEQDGEWV